jgi:hypothetical protein
MEIALGAAAETGGDAVQGRPLPVVRRHLSAGAVGYALGAFDDGAGHRTAGVRTMYDSL